MKNVHKLTEGAILLAIFAVLLLIVIYVPVIGMVANLFLSIPFIMFAAKGNWKNALVFLVGAIFISFIVGTVFAIPLTLAYGLTGIVMGDLIRRQKGRMETFIAGTLAFLVMLILQYVVAIVLFNINFVEELVLMMQESIHISKDMLAAVGQDLNEPVIEQFEASIRMIESIIPSLFVVASLVSVFLIQLVSFPIVKRFGIPVAHQQPFRDISFPKSILWYYLIAIFATFVFQPSEGSYLYMVLINLTFVLQLLMVVQGLSFVYYYSHIKGYSKALPIVATVLTIFTPFLLSIVRILGIIDLGFGLRQRLVKK